MDDVEIITNMLNNYSGLPDFVINTLRCFKYDGQPYHIYFSDSINFKFLVKENQDFNELVESIHKRYLDESHEPGMDDK